MQARFTKLFANPLAYSAMHGKSRTGTPAVEYGAASAGVPRNPTDARAPFVLDYLNFLRANGYECDFFSRQPDGLYKSIDGVVFTQAQIVEIARTAFFDATDGAGGLVDGTGKPREIYLSKNLGI